MTLTTVGILGPVAAWAGDGTQFDLGPQRHSAVLATLALRVNTPVPSAELIDVVWGDGPPPNARNLIHTYVCRLRRIIAPDRQRWDRHGVLRNFSGGYQLVLPHGRRDV